MVATIIIGHGSFGSSILDSAEMIIGKQQNIKAINFLKDDSLNDIDQRIQQALSQLDTDNGVIILTDLMGGTPFNRSMVKAAENSSIRVIAGVNMPLVIELLNQRTSCIALDTLVQDIIQSSREMIVFGNKLI